MANYVLDYSGSQINTKLGNATTTSSGVMSAEDKIKLNGIENEANKTLIDDTLTEEGQAADAKATGDAILDLNSDISDIQGVTGNGALSGFTATNLTGAANELKNTLNSKAEQSDLTSLNLTGTTNNTGSQIDAGTYFYLNGALVKAKVDIASGATFTNGTNYETVTAGGLNDLLDKLSVSEGNITIVHQNITAERKSYHKFGRIVILQLTFTVSAAITDNTAVLFSGVPEATSSFRFRMPNASSSNYQQARLQVNANGTIQNAWTEGGIPTGMWEGQGVYISKY